VQLRHLDAAINWDGLRRPQDNSTEPYADAVIVRHRPLPGLEQQAAAGGAGTSAAAAAVASTSAAAAAGALRMWLRRRMLHTLQRNAGVLHGPTCHHRPCHRCLALSGLLCPVSLTCLQDVQKAGREGQPSVQLASYLGGCNESINTKI
jgi:hypothetical protein